MLASLMRLLISDSIEKTSTKTLLCLGISEGIIVNKLRTRKSWANPKSTIRNPQWKPSGESTQEDHERIKPRMRTSSLADEIVVAGIAGLMALLSACVVGPNYSRPPVQTPPAYKEQTASTDKEIETWKKAQPSDEIARGKWWEVFHDPSLNGLEDRVNISNQNLKTAEAQFREARALVKLNRASYFPTVSAGTNVTVSHPSVNRSFLAHRPAPRFSRLLTTFYRATCLMRQTSGVEFAGWLKKVAMLRPVRQTLRYVRLSVQSELA
jgi:hypothetical protein